MSSLAPPRGQVDRSSPLRSLNPVWTAALLLAAALVAWIVTIDRMWGMDAGPGTDLGGLGWFTGIWVTMMAAMMLPSVAPMALLFARISGERRRQGRAFVPTWVFLAGYLAAWTAYGLAAYGLFRLVTAFGTDWLAWDRAGPYVTGGAIAAAGLYQLTPLKEVCLRHCRGPMHYVLHGWRDGKLGALRMGAEHGLFCVGCCWGLMVALFAVGVMSLFWMAVVAAVIFAEKVLPHGLRLARVFAVALVALGIWIAAAPGSVPGLTDPDAPGSPSMQMSP
jgi:predicted metal-binding membrane protein